jgi:hypothetical protein
VEQKMQKLERLNAGTTQVLFMAVSVCVSDATVAATASTSGGYLWHAGGVAIYKAPSRPSNEMRRGMSVRRSRSFTATHPKRSCRVPKPRPARS